MNVVIVESPAKARTIEKYLGSDYRVLATYGHVCDLPSKDGSVRPDEDFAMDYVADPKSAKRLKNITDAVKESDRLVLATDPDREGEAIAWHVLNHLEKKGALTQPQTQRVVFHEITRDAVLNAVANPRNIDMDLVNAQQARRALDYLVGFTLSPVLWRKVPGSRSAGRVQSVALRLVVDREMEIEAFKSREYWTVDVALTTPSGAALSARLVTLDSKKLDKFALPDKAAAADAVERVKAGNFNATKVERKQVRRNPAPPFTTSTLQQEAARKLGYSAQHTMRVAQTLYEGGLITYMRTDAVTLSSEALEATRLVVAGLYGKNYLPEQPRRYKTRSKNAQEAHEAIRPTDPARVADEMSLARDEARLYELIWNRTVACQMASAVFDQVRFDIDAADGSVGLRATGSVVAFDGYLKLYTEGRDDPAKDDDEDHRLPNVDKGHALGLTDATPEQHFTEPPPRYSEASLVKRMEELGIGRPSTYASIISVLQDRDYVTLVKKRFQPEDRGRLVTAFLENFFQHYVEYDFTARLEDQLDQISNGELEWKGVLREFWSAFSLAVTEISDLRVREILDTLNQVLGPRIFPENSDGKDPRVCPRCNEGQLSLKLGKFGAFIGCSAYPECRFTRPLVGANGENATDDALAENPMVLGNDSDGTEITLRKGPYGLYVQCGEAADGEKPKRSSLPTGTGPDDVDLDVALGLLALPRNIGPHPESGEMISAGIGRYGPYVKHDKAFKSLMADDDVLTIGINRAVALLAEPSRGRGGAKPLKVLGKHPDDHGDVALFSGRYGPYVKHGRINATLPKSENPDSVTLETALTLIADKSAKKGKNKRAPVKRKAKSKRKRAGSAK